MTNLEQFLYFNCPECEFKEQNKEYFVEHALNEHPKAQECLFQFTTIKKELFAEEFEENTEENFKENCENDQSNEEEYLDENDPSYLIPEIEMNDEENTKVRFI